MTNQLNGYTTQRVTKLKASEKAFDIIKYYESLSLKTYLCPAGKHTVGYGHTGSDVVPGMTINEECANAFLHLDVQSSENKINEFVKVPLTQNQFDALVSFTFNVGAGNLKESMLLKKINLRDYAGAANEFPRWNKARNQENKLIELSGLTARRKKEKELFEL